MLVRNGVVGDSRVQKSAASAAAAGWDVTLIGRSESGQTETWKIGDADVRLVPVKRGFHAHNSRHGWLRAPLAYPPGPRRAQRERQLRNWRAQIGEAKTRLAVEGHGLGTGAQTVRKLALAPRRAGVKLAGKWIDLRAKESARLTTSRKAMDSWIDRVADRFWISVMGDKVWRRFDPRLWEYETAFGPVLDRLEADLIHANDFEMLGVGARAAMRRRAKGKRCKLVWDAHEFLPGMKPWVKHPRWHKAQIAHERDYASSADGVVTVSEPIAKLLKDSHGLAELPTVVMNAPDVAASKRPGPSPSIREACGLGPEVPLIVYSGAISIQRGLGDMIEALPQLHGVHCALVVGKPEGDLAVELAARAAELGVSGRLHILPYVEYWQVVPFLSSADVGLIPIHHFQNHELALITKFFEYAHARLPIVVSDVETMGGMVRMTGQGEVFRAGDPVDLAVAVKRILADPKPYRATLETGLLDEWTWAAQAERLHDMYRNLLSRG
ncbi:glycosyltransferase family 4 protein [Glycomyces buryatensis]|nr:glycosyltransferase family 4 protein [Glycomyces buryatensis]